jgi:hypothetical protein
MLTLDPKFVRVSLCCLLIAACNTQPASEQSTEEMNISDYSAPEAVAQVPAGPAEAAYHVEGLFDHVGQNGVWIYTDKGTNDFAEVADLRQVAGLKDGDPIALACEDAGLVTVGTDTYTRRATDYSGCTVVQSDDAQASSPTSDYKDLADRRREEAMEKSLRSMSDQ